MKTISVAQNEILAHNVLKAALQVGTTEFCLCPGARNVPFLHLLRQNPHIKVHYWYEERSAAFFALGRIKATGKPVGVITTSGSAAGELLPATMEAYYIGAPLILITADRPRRFRGTGAPQSVEQDHLFGIYAHREQDLAGDEECDLSGWSQRGPCHLNVCLEEPSKQAPQEHFSLEMSGQWSKSSIVDDTIQLDQFLDEVKNPLVVVSALKKEHIQAVESFLAQLNAPVFLEAASNLRSSIKISHLRIHRSDNLWKSSEAMGYKIDGILRIGGVPTFRLWRDLEYMKEKIKVCSISENPFSGLSWGSILQADLDLFFNKYNTTAFQSKEAIKWLDADKLYQMRLQDLISTYHLAETSQVNRLSRLLPERTFVYLGNSLPIREWDMAAANDENDFHIAVSRGVNGIDGQISTFLGMCCKNRTNVGLFGDLTALYDLAAPWIIPQLDLDNINIIVINNGGGKIFERVFNDRAMLNEHHLNFEHIAHHWKLDYCCWREIPCKFDFRGKRIIEIIPDEQETAHFWQEFDKI